MPFNVAMTLVSVVGSGIRFAFGWRNDCFSTARQPPQAELIFSNSPNIQSRAAPIPLFGLSCSDSVFRVPKETSFLILDSIFLAETSRTIFCISGSSAACRDAFCAGIKAAIANITMQQSTVFFIVGCVEELIGINVRRNAQLINSAPLFVIRYTLFAISNEFWFARVSGKMNNE